MASLGEQPSSLGRQPPENFLRVFRILLWIVGNRVEGSNRESHDEFSQSTLPKSSSSSERADLFKADENYDKKVWFVYCGNWPPANIPSP